MEYKAAIFDLDGTLVNSLADLADSANEMLAGYGFPTHGTEKYRYFVGNGSRKLIERSLPPEKAANSAFVEEALAKYKKCYEKNLLHKTKPYGGINEMLAALKERGIPMGICTNKHQSAAEAIIGKLFPAGLFREAIGDKAGLPRKPDPQKILAMAEHFGVKPEEVAYLGDSDVDMATAVNAGALPVGVEWGFRTRQELEAGGAKVILGHPRELWVKVKFASL